MTRDVIACQTMKVIIIATTKKSSSTEKDKKPGPKDRTIVNKK